MSRCWGWLAERPLPETFRPTIYGLYSFTFGVNLEEAVVSDFKYVETFFLIRICSGTVLDEMVWWSTR